MDCQKQVVGPPSQVALPFRFLITGMQQVPSLSNICPSTPPLTQGYTRIIKLGHRLGDAAPTCFIELVDFDENMAKSPKAGKKTRRSRRSSSKAEAAPAAEETPAAEAAE